MSNGLTFEILKFHNIFRVSAGILAKIGMSEEVILVVFLCFFQDLCEFVIHCNKRNIHLCLFVLFSHYYWWK